MKLSRDLAGVDLADLPVRPVELPNGASGGQSHSLLKLPNRRHNASQFQRIQFQCIRRYGLEP
jgi:hypothetical protein